MAKLLLFCPTYTHDGLDMFWPDSRASFNALQAPEGVEVERIVGRDNPYDIAQYHRYRNTLHQFQQAQKIALESGFDGLVTFESDMLVPPDGITKLWETKADVVYGLYVLRHGSNVVNAFRKLEGSPNIDQSVSLFPELYQRGVKAGWLAVSGCGTGFTLIRRNVLERFPLRNWDEGSFAPDWALASDCQRAGLTQICRFDVLCGHIEQDGRVLWPGDHGAVAQVRALERFTASIHGESVHFEPGDEREIPAGIAADFARCAYLTILDDAPGRQMLARPRKKAKK